MDGVKEGVFEEAKERFEETFEHYETEYLNAEEDVNFALGMQWPESELRKRAADSRPALIENHCLPFVEQIVNTAREMRPAIKVSPVDDQGDIDTAEVYKGAIRNIERQSKASVAYDTSVQNSVMSGYGWIMIDVDYDDPLSFTQEAKIVNVPDWRSCMIDRSATMIDGSDAEFGFHYTDIPEDEFEERWPDKDKSSFDGYWSCDEGDVRVVDYYYKEYEEEHIFECFLADGTTAVLTKEQKEAAEAMGLIVQVLQDRKTRIPTVKACKLYGGGELEKTEWLGQYIPIIPVYGKLVWHEGRLRSYSLIRQAKDPQRMLNIVETTIAEIVGSQPKSQPTVGAVGQFNTDERWANANIENYATLEYDPVLITDDNGQSMLAPPPQKQMPMQIPPALFQIKANAVLGVSSALGMFEENRGEESNAISGIAVKARQIRGDKATFHFIDNLACSIRHVGVILIDLIPKIYNKKQIMRIIGSDDKEKIVTVDPNAQTDKTQGIYNLGAGKYDVDVDVGPSYATQQQEFLDISKELLRVTPEYAAIAGDKIIEAAGGPYADVISERIRANMPAELQSDDPMAMKVLELSKALQASQKETENALIALDTKKKNEEFDNQIKAGELQIKKSEAETDRLMTLAKIEEMRLKAQGAESEALADISEAVMEIGAMLQNMQNRTEEHSQVIDLFISQEEAKKAQAQPQ